MSYDIYVNESYTGPLASIHGWAQFMSWADQLDLDSYDEIVRLTEYCFVEDLTRFRKQLRKAIRQDDMPSSLVVVANLYSSRFLGIVA
jgi:hypothetical protein